MSVSADVLDAQTIQAYLREVADALPDTGEQHVLVLVGGALLAWAGIRGTTRDVDSIRKLDEDLRAAVATVAGRHGLSINWVNDRAQAFAPATLRHENCEVLWEHERLQILAAPWPDVFLMKLAASRDSDWDDLVAIWSRSGFGSPAEAVAAFYAAYPLEEFDPYLEKHVSRIAKSADKG